MNVSKVKVAIKPGRNVEKDAAALRIRAVKGEIKSCLGSCACWIFRSVAAVRSDRKRDAIFSHKLYKRPRKKTVILEHSVFSLFERCVIIEHVRLGFH